MGLLFSTDRRSALGIETALPRLAKALNCRWPYASRCADSYDRNFPISHESVERAKSDAEEFRGFMTIKQALKPASICWC